MESGDSWSRLRSFGFPSNGLLSCRWYFRADMAIPGPPQQAALFPAMSGADPGFQPRGMKLKILTLTLTPKCPSVRTVCRKLHHCEQFLGILGRYTTCPARKRKKKFPSGHTHSLPLAQNICKNGPRARRVPPFADVLSQRKWVCVSWWELFFAFPCGACCGSP